LQNATLCIILLGKMQHAPSFAKMAGWGFFNLTKPKENCQNGSRWFKQNKHTKNQLAVFPPLIFIISNNFYIETSTPPNGVK
jgi:hypothetical protein